MAKVSPIQNSFNAGEFSPLMYGRTDFDKYKNALKVSINGIPLIQGGWTRRPGTTFVAEVKTSSAVTRLVAFRFSVTQAYILEFGNLYMRVYRDHAQVTSGGPAYEMVTPYTTADIPTLKFAQSADTLYVTHPSYAPRKITRTGHAAWSISLIDFIDGPYLTTNTTATTITPSATSGAITLTASAALFTANDVGRHVRLKHSSTWGWARITAYTSSTLVDASVGSGFAATTATADWRLGVWSPGNGYPSCVTFFEDRLFFAGCTAYPQRVDGSKTGNYETFSPTGTDGTIAADNALAYTLNSNDVQNIRWMLDDEKGLLVGTASGEWIVRPSSTSEALSPTNVSAKQSTGHGSANIQPIRASKAAVYLQASRRKLRELAYVFEVDGFRSPDMTSLSEHITKGGITALAYQQEPQSIVWAVRSDGVLLGMTYERDQNVVGWHRHTIGGSGIVESVAVIPEPNGTYDELWMIVKRTINGSTKRYVEYLTKVWETGDTQADAFFVDSGLTYSGAPATTISGLSHLEGATVTVLADGATHPDCTVASGAITLNRSASKVHVGYGYNSDGQMLRIEAGAADGTAQGKTQRIHNFTVRVNETLGIKIGDSFTNMRRIPMRRSSDDTNAAVPLYTGDIHDTFEGDYTTESLVTWRFDQPLPGTVLAVMPQMHTQDR